MTKEQKKYRQQKFGFDPELFIMEKNSKNHATSIHLVDPNLPAISGADDHGGGKDKVWFKPDGFAAELNSAASSCRSYLVPYTASTLREFYNRYGDNYKLSAVPVMRLNKASRSGSPPLGVNEFGCLPDLDAYSLAEKTPGRSDYHDAHRYIGGHIHFGFQIISSIPRFEGSKLVFDRLNDHDVDEELQLMVAGYWTMLQDVFTAIPWVSMLGRANDFGEAKRREYYGQAGSFRVKPYGAEYRVLSSSIMMSPILLTWILGQMRNVTNKRVQFGREAASDLDKKFVNDRVQELHGEYDFFRVRDIVNGHDVDGARSFIEEHGLIDGAMFYGKEFYEIMVEADRRGVQLNPTMFESWGLDGSIVNHRYQGVESFTFGKDQTANIPSVEAFPLRSVRDELVGNSERWSF